MKSLFASLFLVALTFGCKEYASDESMEVVAPTEEVTPVEEIAPAMKVSENRLLDKDSNGGDAPPPPEQPETTEQKIIREANLRFETDDLAGTYGQIKSAVTKHKGIVQNDEEGKAYDELYRHMTIRIPSVHFDAFLADVGKGVSYFDRKEISARDVTEEYIDTEARLKAKKALEVRYLELLKKANKVSEMLEIETQLATIREEIEAKEGALRYMQHRISMSSVHIEFYKKTAAETGATVSYGSKMWNAVKSGFYGISSFFIGLLYIWPFIIILVVLFVWLRKKIRNRKKTV